MKPESNNYSRSAILLLLHFISGELAGCGGYAGIRDGDGEEGWE
jgi:hypothetical protein